MDHPECYSVGPVLGIGWLDGVREAVVAFCVKRLQRVQDMSRCVVVNLIAGETAGRKKPRISGVLSTTAG